MGNLMGNLFSIFDPNTSVLIVFPGNWVAAGLLFLFLPTTYWLAPNQITITINLIIKGIGAELTAVLGNLVPLGRVFNLMRFFLFIIFSNFLGLFPYIFTSSRHLRFTLSLALPFWMGCILWSIIFQYKNILFHLVPVGTPAVLIPVIVIIETIRNLIRPGALAVRLASNMVAGHLLLSFRWSRGSVKSILIMWVNNWTSIINGIRVCSSMYSGICIYNFKHAISKRANKSRV